MTTRTATWLCLCTIALGLPALAADPEPSPAAPAESPLADGEHELVKVVLTDGQELRGHLLADTPDSVSVELLSGGRLDLPRSSIRSVGRQHATIKNGTVWFEDPNRTRYFYGPSAMTLRAGEGYFSQKELIFTSVAYGLTDHITVLAGTAVPGWFFPGGSGINFIGAVKAGFQVHDYIHVAAGAESLVLPGFGGVVGGGFVFGSGTFGTRNFHATISAGKPFLFSSAAGNIGEVIVTASGSARLLPNLALVTENWFFPTATTYNSEPLMFNAGGLRFMGDHLAADIGLIRIPGSPIPVPWLDFTYNFGG